MSLLTRKPLYRNLPNQQQTNGSNFNIFKGKRFYCGNLEKLTKDTCCFNHIVGLPYSEKTGKINPLFDYEKMIVDNIFYLQDDTDPKNRHVWVKKATGLGITELILRLMLWLCVRDNRYHTSQMCIITGPGIDVALGLIRRMKDIFAGINIFIENKETVLEVNGVIIKAFPSNHLSTYRGLTSPKFIFLDEADFIKENEIQEVRDTTERYITKSKPYIVMVSTPNKPDLLFQMIEQEQEDKCIYRRLFFNYEWGIGKMFTQEEIEVQKISPSFDREYDLKYAGKIGNVFSTHDIEKAVALGEQYKDIPFNYDLNYFAGIDPGFSKITPLYIGELNKELGCLRIVYCKRYDRIAPKQLIDDIWELHKKFLNLVWFIDSSNRGFINDLQYAFDEPQNWQKADDVLHTAGYRILPVNFGGHEHEHLLEHTHSLVSGGMIAIPREYEYLLTAMRTAKATEWDLDKNETVYDDDLDALRCMLKGVKIT